MNIYGSNLERTKTRINEIVPDDDLNGEERLTLLDEGSLEVSHDDWILGEPTGEDSVIALRELIVGIFLWGLIIQLTVVWFLNNKISFSVGLWFGCVFASGLAYSMWYTLDKAMDMIEKNAQSYLASRSILRYLSIVIMLGIVMIFFSDYMHPLAVFVGVMTLKLGAYTQPLVDKIYKQVAAKQSNCRKENR